MSRLMRIHATLVLFLSLLAMSQPATVGGGEKAAGQGQGSDWPQFLGPDRNGISAETGLLDEWPADGLKAVWRVPGGVGMSGLTIASGKLFTLVQREGKQHAVAHDAATGKPLWSTPIAAEYENAMGHGPRATPAIAGETVYVFTGDGVLAALNAGDGSVQWKQNLIEELGGKVAEYGMACSPLLVDDRVIVTAGLPQATVVAYDLAKGNLLWKADLGDPAGYSSPAVLNVGGRKQLVVFDGRAAAGLNPKSGETLWRYEYVTDYNCNIATPLEFKGQVFLSAGENHGSVLLSLKPAGETFTAEETWTSQGPGSTLRNEWQTSMLLDGRLYGFDNVGSAGPVTHLTCVDAETGKRVWQQPRFGKGNLIAADGKLWLSTMQGELVVARATPDGYQELGRAELLGKTRQAPALSHGRLYLRDDREIVCIDVRKP